MSCPGEWNISSWGRSSGCNQATVSNTLRSAYKTHVPQVVQLRPRPIPSSQTQTIWHWLKNEDLGSNKQIWLEHVQSHHQTIKCTSYTVFSPSREYPRHPQRNKNTDPVILPKLFLTFSSAKVLNNCFPVGYIPIEWPFPQQSSKHCDPPRIARGCSGVAKQIVCISNPEACNGTYPKMSYHVQIDLGNHRKCSMN